MIRKTRKGLKRLVLPKFSLAAQKNLSCPKIGGTAAPLAPHPPARTPMFIITSFRLVFLFKFKQRVFLLCGRHCLDLLPE